MELHVVLRPCRKPRSRITSRRTIVRRSGRVTVFPSEAILSRERPEILCQRAPGASIARQLVVSWTLCRTAFCRSMRAKVEASFQHLGSSHAQAFGCQRSRPQRLCVIGARRLCVEGRRARFVDRGEVQRCHCVRRPGDTKVVVTWRRLYMEGSETGPRP